MGFFYGFVFLIPNPRTPVPRTLLPVRTDALDFDLPDGLIATTPAEPRDSARLMVIHRETQTLEHRRVRDLPELGVVKSGDLMVVNRSRVLPAYLEGVRTKTDGKVTGLFLDTEPNGVWSLMIETRGKPEPGETITLGDELNLELLKRTAPGMWSAQPRNATGATLDQGRSFAALQRVGRPPLPPYIRKARKTLGLPELNEADVARYNTVYADDPGSVAAPTAGLHFTPELLTRLDQLEVRRAGVTLHVGVGTFMPVRADHLDDHDMHAERYHVPADTLTALHDTRQRGGRTLVVGTTAVRTLESLPHPLPDAVERPDGLAGETRLFIRPDAGFTFRHTDALLTNFHLPRSTLLAMVAALPGVGLENLLAWYREAIEHGYRFYSYGDAMLLCE